MHRLSNWLAAMFGKIHPLYGALAIIITLTTTSYLMGANKTNTHLQFRARVDSMAIDSLRNSQTGLIAKLDRHMQDNVSTHEELVERVDRAICVLLRRDDSAARREQCLVENYKLLKSQLPGS